MLNGFFLSVLNMSIVSSYVIAFVLITRLLLKKTPKIFSFALWAVVLFRLLCPFSFESVLSILPKSTVPISQDILYSRAPQINTGIGIVDNSINPVLPVPNMGDSVNPLQVWSFIASLVWIIGIIALLIYSVAAFIKLKRNLSGSIPLHDNSHDHIYLADHISLPFVMGLIKPKIYLPSSLSAHEQDFIIAHETCHIKRLDHITRILAFIALALHWFNPLVWIAFILSGKDMELSCDEAVTKQMDSDIRVEYSQSLLRFATGRKMLHATPLAFGEGDTKSRVKNVLSYKKPAFWVSIVAVVVVICISVGLMSNSKQTPVEVNGISVENLWKSRTKYVGDNAAVGNILSELKFPEKLKYNGFQLFTDEPPYSITVNFTTDTETRNFYTGALNQTPLEQNAIIMFSLIENVEQIIFNLDDGKNPYSESFYRESAQATMEEENLFAKTETIEGFGDLIKEIPNKLNGGINDLRPMIMVDDILYLDTNKEISAKIEDSAVLGKITSAALASEKPTENGQCNFSSGVGAKYAAYEDGVAVFLNNKWFFFEKDTETTDIGVTAGAKLSSLPKEYSSSMAEKNGDYVDVHGKISNAETMDYFISAVSKKEKAFIRTTIYTIEGDPVITDFAFDGKSFSIYRDTTRDKFGNQEIKNYTYQNLVPFISDDVPKTQYFFITNLSEITKKNFEDGVDGIVLLRTDMPKSTTEPVSTEYTMMKLGKNGEVLSSYSLKGKELADAILFDALSKSAAWEGMDVSTLEECYLIRKTLPEVDEIHDYYAYRLSDGTSVLQSGTEGRYSTLSSDLYLQLVDSFKSNTYLFFWLKPDEPPQLIGDTAANVWLKSFMNEQTPAESRLSDYEITDVKVITGEPKKNIKWEDMAYQYVVHVTYNITTATEQYLAAGDGVSGKGLFQGLFRELCVKVKAKDGGGFQIVSVGTGGGEQEFLKK